jgi:tetratricopeptide (TPR) repeat protein
LQHHCGDDEGAWNTLQRLLSFAPDDSQRADLLVMLGKDDQALAAYSADIDKEIESEKKKSGPAEQIRKGLAKTFAGVPFASSVFGLPDNQDIPGFSKEAAVQIDDKATLANLYCDRGDFYFKRGDFNKAISDYDLAASTSDNASSDRKDLAYLLAYGPKKTIALITKRVSEGGYSADDQLYLSELYKRISEPAKAAACKKKAFAEINGLIKDDPKDANNIWARGQLYMRTGEFQKALSDFSRAIALNKDPDVSYYSARARCFTALGRFDLAIKDADKAQTNTAVIPKAVSLFGKGSTKEALTEFNTALDNDEFNTNALYGRSRLYQKLGNKKAAEIDLALATKYGYFVNPELVRYNYDKF